MNEFRNGDIIVEVTKNPRADILQDHENNFKPTDLATDKRKWLINVEI